MSPNYIKSPLAMAANVSAEIEGTVQDVLADVKTNGDAALAKYSQRFDRMVPESLEVSSAEIKSHLAALDPAMREDSEFAIDQVTTFAKAQMATIQPLEIETLPGLHLGHRVIPIKTVGAYIPGGRYPLMSAPIMTLVPAKVAGCAEVIACLPPTAPPEMIAGCHLSGADRIFRVGGAQAIAAMAYGTATIPRVNKIFGPGNAYVNEAKRQVFGPVGIDQLAGPSEIFTLADETGDAEMIAIDLLAQAEHDIHARVGLITTSKRLAHDTLSEITKKLKTLKTANVAAESWERFGEITLWETDEDAIAYCDDVAPEHLQIHTSDPDAWAEKVSNYGSLFIGENASVVYSDKCCGTNHTLPTSGAAHYTGGLWVGSYLKICTHQRLNADAIRTVAPHAVRQATFEKMDGHAQAANLRLKRLQTGS